MLKICEQCGDEFTPKKNKVRFCSFECGKISSIAIARKHGEKKFRQNFDIRFNNKLEYVSGYTNSESVITVRCLSCGELLSRSAQVARKNKQLTCNGCARIAGQQERDKRELLRIKKKTDKLQHKKNIREEEGVRRIERLKGLEGKTCNECGNMYNALIISQKYCSVKCGDRHSRRVKEISRRHQLRKNGKINWDITLDKIITRDNNVCHICKRACNKNDHTIDDNGNFITGNSYPSIDHLLPVTKGGTHTWGNVKLAHMYCNTLKNNNETYVNSSGQLTLAM